MFFNIYSSCKYMLTTGGFFRTSIEKTLDLAKNMDEIMYLHVFYKDVRHLMCQFCNSFLKLTYLMN